MARKLISKREKVAFLDRVNVHVANGGSVRGFCQANQLFLSQIRRWRRDIQKLSVGRMDAVTVHAGRKSSLLAIEEDIVRWIFELRQQGMAVSISMIVAKAG